LAGWKATPPSSHSQHWLWNTGFAQGGGAALRVLSAELIELAHRHELGEKPPQHACPAPVREW